MFLLLFFVDLVLQHITGIARLQMRLSSLEDTIGSENQVCFIDAFVGVLNLSEIGFEVKMIKNEGRHE
ncbi:hypothetical protein [Flavobacterium branchiophilum]|uniref:hypothetical protein n=1 Tax=Flavobacterium branchiophilum TaxID=55197 RepID=UPI0002FAC341|nr:hypothetical protein [Flavobacterium branchiophilum]